MTDWAIAILRTGSEKRMHHRCKEIGVESYCPMLRQKGRRRRGEPGREAIERPALAGYLPVRGEHVDDAREGLDWDSDFRDFLRDIDDAIAFIRDSELDPLRAMEKSEPVKFISGPVFYLGEKVKVPYGNESVSKAFWSREGTVVAVKNGRYCLGGSQFPLETWFSGCQLLKPAV